MEIQQKDETELNGGTNPWKTRSLAVDFKKQVQKLNFFASSYQKARSYLSLYNVCPLLITLYLEHSLKYKENLILMAATATAGSFLMKGSKVRSLGRYSSKQVRQQRARLYIIWRCTVLLLCWND
ncbi:hypothetical protein RYX36_019125 [Vicia faba]